VSESRSGAPRSWLRRDSYLVRVGTIDTPRESGLILHADRVVSRFRGRSFRFCVFYEDTPIERLPEGWKWLSLCFNRVNTAMGKNPFYPFDFPQAVVRKLVQKVIRETGRTAAAGRWCPDGTSAGMPG
jgi:hypothetical protein